MSKIDKPVAVPDELVMEKIFVIRGKKVMLDRDLAKLYGVDTKRLKEQVRRNLDRFPEDFMFEVNNEEFTHLRTQIATSSWGGARYNPMAFSDLGVAMLSSVLNSKQAIAINIQIMRVFASMRELFETNREILKKLDYLERKDIEQDNKIILIFKYLKKLEQTKQKDFEQKRRNPIGFKR